MRRRAQEVQSVLFEASKWSIGDAKAWLRDHDFKAPDPDVTEDDEGEPVTYRFRQFDPDRCSGQFETLTENLPEGVSMVSCEVGRSAAAPMDPEVERLRRERLGVVQIPGVDGPITVSRFLRESPTPEVRKDPAHQNRLRIVISSDAEDRYGDIIRQDAWDFRNYMRNPIVLFGHWHYESGGSPPSQGRTVELSLEKRADKMLTWATMEFHRASRFNEELYQMYAGGFMSADSVGFMDTVEPKKRDSSRGRPGLEFVGQELLEHSLVAVGANPDAVDEYADRIKSAAAKGLIRARTAEYFLSLGGRNAEGAPLIGASRDIPRMAAGGLRDVTADALAVTALAAHLRNLRR